MANSASLSLIENIFLSTVQRNLKFERLS